MQDYLLLIFTLFLATTSLLKADELTFFKKAKGNRNYCQQEEILNLKMINNDDSSTGKIDYILVSKIGKKVFLFSGKKLIKIFPVVFGKNPVGPKQFEGDLKTPEGLYYIADKNPESKYHKSLQISYPTKDESVFAQSQGKIPGDEVMFHGLPNIAQDESMGEYFKRIGITKAQSMGINWTKGCIAMTNEDIDEMYALISIKTLVEICPLREEK